jgi:RHS repeat-associated protein
MRLQSAGLKTCVSVDLPRFPRVRLLTGVVALVAALASASPDALVDGVTLHPGGSNNCGAIALHELTVALKGAKADTRIIDAAPVPANGFSMTELLALSAKTGLDLIAVQSPVDGPIPVPSLVHWKRGHYSAIVDQRGSFYKVSDPSFPTRWLSGGMIMEESSRDFLMQQDKITATLRRIAQSRTDLIRGGSYPAHPGYPDTNDFPNSCGGGGGGGGGGGCSSCIAPAGMAIWRVSEPYINLWLMDEPLGYNPGLGNRISFQLNYKQRETLAGTNSAVFSCGPKWNCSWIGYVIAPSTNSTPGTTMTMVVAGGGERAYTADGATHEYYSRSVMSVTTNTNGVFTGCTVLYPNGASEYYNYVFTNSPEGVLCFRTAQTDPAGHSTQFIYTQSSRTNFLLGVVDTDGRTNTLSYTNTSFPNQISGVTDPFGRNTTLQYNTNGLLTNITDVVNLSSAFAYGYGTNQWITSLTTHYGATTFSLTDNNLSTNNAIDRAALVVDPLSGTNLYVSRYQAGFLIGTTYTVPYEPAGAPSLSSTSMTNLNSWHWGPMQCPQLSTTNMYSFTSTDYLKGRQRNWLFNLNGISFSDALNMEQAVSPDGSTPGQQTWSAYDGEVGSVQGTNALQAVLAWNLPDGNSYYQWTQRNVWGNPAAVQETWSQTFGGPSLIRTNQYFYYANGIDLQQQIGPLNETVGGFGYDTHHDVLTATNAVGYVTTYTYDGQSRLTSVTSPAGLTTTNLYFSSGSYTNWIQQRIDLQIHRTNSYFYTNDLLGIRTNELGLVVSHTWDNLQRLTSTSFPDSTYTSNIYANLDPVEAIDRLGHQTQYGYDQLRHMVAVTNALTNVTLFHYCSCGALEYMQDALNHYTYYYYDVAGRQINIVYPDSTSITNNYNPLSQITNTTDGAGRRMTNWYTDQGLLYASSNAVGQVFLKSFDIEDRMTNSLDGNGIVTTNSYDYLRRVLVRGYPDGGTERFGYSAFGLAAYTNQLTNSTYYTYDDALRKIAETNALTQVTQYGYDPAGDLTNQTDANNHTTQWSYDAYGRMTNKLDATSTSILQYEYDADNRLTNRWSLAMSNTVYAYDAVGNLTNVTYHSSHALSFSYDAMNQLTSMADGIGTTTFTYTSAGQLASESGPWPSDMVTYTYSDFLRTVLDLQQPNASDWIQTYAYDMAYRLTGITSPAGTFAYTYNPGLAGTTSASSLIAKIALPNGAFITNTYDNNGRMQGTWLTNSAGSNFDSSAYTYNVGNQRTAVDRGGENTAAYTYDLIGQLTGDVASEGTTNRMNEQLHYAFDPAGNLNYRTNNTLIENFQVNSLNELTENTNGGRLTVLGTTTSQATNVTVNGTNALRYGDATFAATNMPLTTTYTATASDSYGRHSTNTVTVSIATNTAYQYDGNGNLTNDGLRSFAYDDENQLIQVWVTNYWLSQFTYDGKMRRRIRQEFTWQSSGWVQTNEVYYIYDGNVVIQERDINKLPATTYTRGLDLSGTLEGADLPRQIVATAGGVGGLLSMTLNSEPGNSSSNSLFYHADGNGNVTMLLNGSQAIVAKYLYDAFGNILSKSGLLADANLYRFSSKEAHLNSGLVYYLYRYYDPHLQRWPNRDPFLESGFETARNLLRFQLHHPSLAADGEPDLYSFVRNCAPNEIDVSGLVDCAALANQIDNLYAQIAKNPPNAQQLERQLDTLESIWSRFCWRPPPSNPDPCPIQIPIQPPPNNNNNTYTPPNLWPYLPPTIIIIIITPWPGNPIYGFL